jgi:hypothetical protein
MTAPRTRQAFLVALVVAAACGPVLDHSKENGEQCEANGQCISDRCVEGICAQCAASADCTGDTLCGHHPRYSQGGPAYCISADAGCSSSPESCPDAGGFYCTTCPTGFRCQDTTGSCYDARPPPPPVCGESELGRKHDAGWGPGPDVSGKSCYSCIGCPFGSSCVCGASGLVGGVRCDGLGSGLACFVTGGIGSCRIFPGDCASNAQCTNTPATPICSREGRCVACQRDVDCPGSADGGAQGCINNSCYSCCGSTSDCPRSAPQCLQGFCYACDAYDGGCDGGTDGGSSDGGADGGSSDAGSGDDAGSADAGDGG